MGRTFVQQRRSIVAREAAIVLFDLLVRPFAFARPRALLRTVVSIGTTGYARVAPRMVRVFNFKVTFVAGALFEFHAF